MGRFVGIDLGTTFCAVSTIDASGRPTMLPNRMGNLLTPSVIDLRHDPPLIGEEAKENQEFGDEGVVAFFKRDMGDQHALFLEEGRQYSPIDLSTLMLGYLKEGAEIRLGAAITDAVITVPAYFNNMQREATIKAGHQAGLNVLRIISEPTAAALAYGLRPTQATSTVLVYDLGGGTFDISLVQITPDALRVIGTEGDHYLGGKDWDDRILRYLADRFEADFGAELIGENFNHLLVQAENVKKTLSTRETVSVPVQAEGHHATYEITREQFEALTVDLMERTQKLVEQVLHDAEMTWSEMAGVLLVGGATRMPMVHDYVWRMSGKPPMGGVDPDQAVAVGAAIQAAMDIEARQPHAEPLLLLGRKETTDVISNSLGMIVENADRTAYINSVIIRKNQPIPTQQTRPFRFRLSASQDSRLEVFMTQGEIEDPAGCAYLGMYVLSDFPPLPPQQEVVIDVTYAYDHNGVVQVTAVERTTKQSLTITVEPLPADVPGRFAKPPEIILVPEHTTLYMAIDLSGSMFGRPLKQAKAAAHRFLSETDLTHTSIGIIEFSEKTRVKIRASQSAKVIGQGIDKMRSGSTGYGTSANPFKEVFELLSGLPGKRYGLILTDGQWTQQKEAIRIAKRCHKVGIEIIAVGFGQADKAFLKAISSSDEHSFFTDLNALTETFSTIAQELTEGGLTLL